jgi:hypothetical protein
MAHPVTPRATFTWGPTARHIRATPHLSHYQVFGRGLRSYYNGRWDSVAIQPVRKRLVVAGTARANLRRVTG